MSSVSRCDWCDGPMPPDARRDAVTCSQRCRQARWRFRRGAGAPTSPGLGPEPIRVGYADPPYPGKAGYYRDHPDYGGEVDHEELLTGLGMYFPDGWALSTSAEALPVVLSLADVLGLGQVRVAAWFRGERPTSSYRPLSAWEPVVYAGGRDKLLEPDERRTDALVHVSRPRLTDPNRVVGAKPAEFCYWLFALLGLEPGDELIDLFPGSGGVARAWRYASGAARHTDGQLRLAP